MRDMLAILGALIVLASGIPYIIDTIKRKTKPNIVSWFTWALLINIGAFAALSDGQLRTAIITFGDAAQVTLILFLGIKYGYAKMTWFDGVCQLSAVLGLVLWLVFNSPAIAILASIGIDLIAALPTFRHAWKLPSEETWQTYLISGVGAAVGLLSISVYSLTALAYPLYVCLLGIGLSATIIIARRRQGIALNR